MRSIWVVLVLTGLLVGCVQAPVGTPPGQGGIPPGQGGIPPGQAKKMAAPPPVVVTGSPALILLPGTNVYTVSGVENVYVVSGVYYYYYQGIWYTGPSFQGPWVSVASQDLPPGLKGGPPGQAKKPQVPPGQQKKQW